MVEFINQIRKYPHRFLETGALFTSFIGLGFSLGVVGPTLLDLQTQVQRELSEVAYALPARAGGYALGSLIMGFVFNKLSYLIAASICMCLTCILTALMPHVYELHALLIVFFLNGGFLGFFEAGANMQLLHLWGKENPPFMQALHLCYGVGALVVPLIAKPFLLQSETAEAVNQDNVRHNHSIQSMSRNESSLINDSLNDLVNRENLQLVYPYSVVAGILAFNCVYFFVLWKFYPKTEEHPSRKIVANAIATSSNNKKATEAPSPATNDENSRDKEEKTLSITYSSETLSPSSGDKNSSDCHANESLAVVLYKEFHDNVDMNDKNVIDFPSPLEGDKSITQQFYLWKGFVIVLTVMFMHIYYGLEITFGSFLTTFAYESDLHLPKADGAHMTSLFWGTFTFLRLFTVFYIEYVGAEMNILLSLVVVLIANVLLVPFGDSHALCLWIGVGVIGLGTSSIWASLFGYLEQYFTVTSRIAAGMIVSAIVGEFVFPLIISNFVSSDPQVLLWVVLFCSVSMTLIFLVMMYIMRTKLRPLITALPHLSAGNSGNSAH